MTTRESALELLRKVRDPELGINIVDLGLVHELAIEDDRLTLKLLMTSPACPMAEHIREEAVRGLTKGLAGEVNTVQAEVVWDPPWTPEMMSDSARETLGL